MSITSSSQSGVLYRPVREQVSTQSLQRGKPVSLPQSVEAPALEASPQLPAGFGQSLKAMVLSKIQFGSSAPIAPMLMDKLMKPASIALVGASEAQGSVGKEVLENLLKGGYGGRIYLVNPKYQGQQTSGGEGKPPLTYYGSVNDLPAGAVDMAVVMTPSRTVPGVMDQLGNKGVKAAVLISAGFKEIGEAGKVLDDQLRQAVERHGMALVGPNCVGIANPAPGVQMNATFVQGKPLPGKGAVVSQSGAVGIDIMNRARRLGLGVSQFVSIGNSMQVDAGKMIGYWKNDPSVKYVMGYLESIPDPDGFRKTVAEMSKSKPVLMIKSGKSSAGAKAASSHTGALAGSDNAVEALFQQTGVQRMDSIQQLFAAAQAFENTKPSVGNRVSIFSNAGGYAVIATDLLEFTKHGLQVANLTKETEEGLKNYLPAAASRKNPVDTTATAPADDLDKYKQGLLSVVNDPNVDSCIVSVVPLMGIKPAEIAKIVASIQQTSDKPIVAMLSTGESELENIQKAVKDAGLPPVALYTSMEDAVSALGALEKHRLWQAKDTGSVERFNDVQTQTVRNIMDGARAEGRKLLTTTESLDILKAYGIKVPDFGLVNTLAQAKDKAREIGYPVVIKLSSKTVTHKTEVGGVVIDIRNEEQLEKAFTEMSESLRKHGITSFQPGEGILVQKFLTKGREVILGLNDDPQFGKMMMLGLGGIYVEVFKDVQFRLNPVTRVEVRDMIEGLKSHKILKGYRGKPGADLEAVENVMLRLSQLASDFPEITEVDINPYMAQPKGADGSPGGMAVDGRIFIKEN